MAQKVKSPSPDPPANEVAPVPSRHRMLPALYTNAEVPMTQWGTNLDVGTPMGWASVLKALQPADWIPSDGGELIINVVAWVSHPKEMTNKETGEVQVITRLVLIGKDGKTAALCGEWTVTNLKAAILSYPGVWPECGMPCRVYADKSRKQGASDYGTFEFRPDLLPPEYMVA